ncbi:hypothetical protein J2125_004682 [Erwinia toletana]|uniref:WGR domain-containing protein n=1 Tax=Winslowiella toletana TaxID=92490 RepID=A0ABS4PHA1_9GAMM|nr:hypothetical protein [Winslowiella toletana]MBP2171490.1 hypothetical protein [Winslowiella toletana]
MSHYYYVDTNHSYNDAHVVHTSGCRYLPAVRDRRFLGTFYTTADALLQAKKYFRNAYGCNDCCPLPKEKKAPGRRKNVDLRPLQ